MALSAQQSSLKTAVGNVLAENTNTRAAVMKANRVALSAAAAPFLVDAPASTALYPSDGLFPSKTLAP